MSRVGTLCLSVLVGVTVATARSADLVAHWPFDADLTDAVGQSHGAAHGSSSVGKDAKVGAGALRLGGAVGDYVKVESNPRLDSDSFSLLYWVKGDPHLETSSGGLCRRLVGFDDFAFETDWNVHSPTEFEINWWWNGTWYKGFADPPKDQWIHLAWTYDASNRLLALYRDGELASLEPNVTLNRKGKALYVGGQYRGSQNFKGLIDDLRLYDGVLDTEQVQSVVHDPAAPLPPAPPAAGPTVRFDFETGDLQGWRVLEGGFAKLLNDRELFRNRPTGPFNKQGKYFLDTVEQGHDPQTGVVESPVIVLTGPLVSLLIGGGNHPDTYLALCTLDGKEVLKAQGVNDEILQRVSWRVPQLVGQKVFLRIADQNQGGWGHVTFDDFAAQGTLDPKATEENFARAELHSAQRELAARVGQVNLEALRQVIADLTETFPARYTHGREFLKRLPEFERQAREVKEILDRGDADARKRAAERVDAILAFQREVLVANPLVSGQPLLFVVRNQYRPDHHNTATMFQKGEINQGSFQGGGALKTLDFAKGGEVTTLLEVPEGIVRDPEVDFTGRRIVFSMRRNADDDYHVYELNTDGSGLKQLTFANGVSDIDPLFLPDGGFAFSSTREPKYCMCNRHIMCTLFRMEGDGANIHQIGKSTLFEGHGALMPDGRILYDRWEYVDRNFGDAQGLWTVDPDGTNHAVFWGNNTWSPGAVLDARVIPGTEQFICNFSSCHDRPWGALALVDRDRGVDGRDPVIRTWPADALNLVLEEGAKEGRGGYGFDDFKQVNPKYEDPYPLSDPVTGAGAGKYFLASRRTGVGEQMGLYLVDVFGNETRLHPEAPGCFDPMPLGPRPRPAAMSPRRNFKDKVGHFYVHDVYEGTHMEGVKRGSVKSLRVVESPEKRFWTGPAWNGQGTIAPAMNWHDFNNKRVLGTVPVEDDGSAYFAVPADKYVFFQLLDADGMMVQSMRSGTIAQPGERTGCIGCHESRNLAPRPVAGNTPEAMRRPAAKLEGWYGEPRLFSYRKEVQPVFDRYCVHCHDFGKPAGQKLLLAGDRDDTFNASYNELWRKQYIHVVGAGPSATQPAYSWGSHASKLVEVLRGGHKDVKLDKESFDRIVTWIDLNAPYYPTYASAYPDNLSGRCPLDNAQLARLTELTGVPFANLNSFSANRGPQLSFDRPELSPCLAPLEDADAGKYREALSIIEAGKQTLTARPGGDTLDGFVACEVDRQREARYERREQAEAQNREALRTGRRVPDGNPPEASTDRE